MKAAQATKPVRDAAQAVPTLSKVTIARREVIARFQRRYDDRKDPIWHSEEEAKLFIADLNRALAAVWEGQP